MSDGSLSVAHAPGSRFPAAPGFVRWLEAHLRHGTGRACGRARAAPFRTLRLWDVEAGKEIQRFEQVHQGLVTCVAFLPGRGRALSGGYDSNLKVWNLRK